MDGKLLAQAVTKYVSGLILVGVLLFVPAGIRCRSTEAHDRMIPLFC